jgi:hypothetical protein
VNRCVPLVHFGDVFTLLRFILHPLLFEKQEQASCGGDPQLCKLVFFHFITTIEL